MVIQCLGLTGFACAWYYLASRFFCMGQISMMLLLDGLVLAFSLVGFCLSLVFLFIES